MEPVKTKEGILKRLFQKTMPVADDADMTYFTLYWETENGVVFEKYHVPDHEGSKALINLLKELTNIE